MRRAVVCLVMLASCKDCDDPPKTVPDASPPPPVMKEAAAPKPAAPADAGPVVDATAYEEIYGEAGASSCRLVWGPMEQPFRGPAALHVNGPQELRLVTNEGGRPRIYPVAIPPVPKKGAPAIVPPVASTFIGVRWPPCELAGKYVYCAGAGGAITRSTLGAQPPEAKVVAGAKVRGGTRIAAGALGPDHSVVAWIDSRHTTEGDQLQAFVALDEAGGGRLSEDGAGATAMRLFPRGAGVVAAYLDARSSQVPIHARPISLKGADLALGDDVVLSVGGPPERGVDLAAASVGARAFVFVPMPKETIDFGMATVPVDDPPKLDVSPLWSLYPNGLDPAPIAATAARDGKSAWVVRTRPRERAVGSPRILELGRVDGAGAFTSLGELGPAKNVTDIALVEDGAGTLWILYGDATVTWLERRICE